MNNMPIWDNVRSGQFIRNAFSEIPDNSHIRIASAFYNNRSELDRVLSSGCTIDLVFRLGFPTKVQDIKGLEKTIGFNGRYLTSRSFHPKLYIINKDYVLIGSANFTGGGFSTNQEIMIKISDPSVVDSCIELFNQYWESGKPITKDTVNKYSQLSDDINKTAQKRSELESGIKDIFGEIGVKGREFDKEDKEERRLIDLEQKYQNLRSGFYLIKEIYSEFEPISTSVPLEIEVDAFLNYVRNEHCKGESYKDSPIGFESNINNLRELISLWIRDESNAKNHYLNDVVPRNYPTLTKALSSPEAIKSLEVEQIVDVLLLVHAFEDQMRNTKGGIDGLRKDWMANVNKQTIHDDLIYLLHGDETLTRRIVNVQSGIKHKIYRFGESVTKEICGWVHTDETPPLNHKSIIMMRYFGIVV